jgi:enamine deaminase RidA (YjgF/YER057c/UK114 family)
MNTALGYSQAVPAGGVLYVSGQVATNERGETVGGPGDIRAHVEQVFKNLRAVLEEGGSGFDRVTKLTVFATSLDYVTAIRQVRHEVFGPLGYYPASTFVVISSLARPDYLVEIEAIALTGDDRRRGRAVRQAAVGQATARVARSRSRARHRASVRGARRAR